MILEILRKKSGVRGQHQSWHPSPSRLFPAVLPAAPPMLWSHPPRPPQQLRRSESPEQRVKETAKEWQKVCFVGWFSSHQFGARNYMKLHDLTQMKFGSSRPAECQLIFYACLKTQTCIDVSPRSNQKTTPHGIKIRPWKQQHINVCLFNFFGFKLILCQPWSRPSHKTIKIQDAFANPDLIWFNTYHQTIHDI